MSVPDLVAFTHARTREADSWLFGRRRTWQVFSLFSLLMVFDFADRMIIAALLPAIRLEWHINDAQAGLLNSALTLGMIVFAFPVALAVDRWSRVKTAGLMGVAWSVAAMVGGVAASFGQLLAARAVVGVGEAGYAPAAYSWIAAAFPRRHLQFALGFFSASAPVGMALGIAGGGYIASHYGWRHAFGIVALPGLLAAALLYRGRDYSNRDFVKRVEAETTMGHQLDGAIESRLRILRIPSLSLSFFMSGMIMMQSVPVFYFLPTYLIRIYGIPLQKASFLASALMLLPIVGTPMGGWIMDRLTQRYRSAKLVYLAISAGLCTTLYLMVFHFAASWQVQYGLLVIASFVGATALSTPMSMTQELVHPRGRAFSSTCGVIASAALGSMPGPYLTGLLSDRFGLRSALASVTLVSGALITVAALLALRFYLRDLDRVSRFDVVLRSTLRS
ncbi:MFS transporter [Paraburkholderia sediminicola]|jgi:predicted MFS family arabinose efflux permease|uniref:MFS transporter n=1 Tax=Paraburkholderia sediminicola TaxID=458836 RepID=UPI0038BB2BFE